MASWLLALDGLLSLPGAEHLFKNDTLTAGLFHLEKLLIEGGALTAQLAHHIHRIPSVLVMACRRCVCRREKGIVDIQSRFVHEAEEGRVLTQHRGCYDVVIGGLIRMMVPLALLPRAHHVIARGVASRLVLELLQLSKLRIDLLLELEDNLALSIKLLNQLHVLLLEVDVV